MKERIAAVALCCALGAAACESTGERTLGVEGTGVVIGVVGVDLVGAGQLGANAPAMRDLEVVLRSRSGRGIMARTTSMVNGVLVFQGVPVGEYEVTVGPGAVPDSLVLVRVDSANVKLGANDTLFTSIVLSYPNLSIDAARAAPVGRSVFIEGVVLNAWPTYGDSTMHIAGETAGIRLIRALPTAAVVGDSVRVRGVRGTRDGQPVLNNAVLMFLRAVEPREAETVDTETAASADGGRLDALFVRVAHSEVTDSATLPSGDFQLTVDDGSGPLNVVFDRNITFRLGVVGPLFEHTLEASGLLVPNGDVTWSLKPRIATEAVARHVPPPSPDAAAR
jgi:hypothetical protein